MALGESVPAALAEARPPESVTAVTRENRQFALATTPSWAAAVWSENGWSSLRCMPRPARVVEHRTREPDHVRLAGHQDRLGLLRVRDQTDRDHLHLHRLFHRSIFFAF